MTASCSSYEPAQNTDSSRRTPSSAPDAVKGHLDAPSVATLAPAKLYPRPEAGPAGHAGDKGDPGNEPAQRIENLPVAAAAAADADENASVENRWYHLRDTVQTTALAVLGRARRQYQDWFDDNDAAINNPFAEKNRLHKVYVTRPTDDNVVLALCNSGCARCRTPGRLEKLRKFKATRTATIRDQSRLWSAN
ncbi:hypothetical protein SprV_0401536000 [Sparganum proliferum]